MYIYIFFSFISIAIKLLRKKKERARNFSREDFSTISDNYRRGAVTVKLRRFGRTGQIVNGENHFHCTIAYALIVMYTLIFCFSPAICFFDFFFFFYFTKLCATFNEQRSFVQFYILLEIYRLLILYIILYLLIENCDITYASLRV